MTEQENEPRVYNAAEVFNFENEMTGRASLDWNCIDGTTRSYIELDTGKDYGHTIWGEKIKLYIEKADGYSREYPFILAIGGTYEDVLNDIAKGQNVYPDVDNVVEGYNAGEDYSKRFNNPENVKLIGFENEEDATKFIIDTFDKHLYDRAFNQMIAKDTYMDSQTLESLIVEDRVNPAWRNEEGKCAFDYDTDEADKLMQLYKDKEWEIPIATQDAEQGHGEAPAPDAPKPHYTVERVPFGEWMARPENAAMRPLIDTLKGHKEIPLYVYTIPNAAKERDGAACAISINSHPGRGAVAMFHMCYKEMEGKDNKGTGIVYRDHTIDCNNFTCAQQEALHHVLSAVGLSTAGVDEAQRGQYTLKTHAFANDTDLLNAYIKVTKAYLTRSQDKSLTDIVVASGNALLHFNADENKRLGNKLISLGATNPKQLGKILARAVSPQKKRQEKSKDTGYER